MGPWQLLSTGYRHPLRQDPLPTIYGPLVFGCGHVVVRTYEGIRYPVHHLTTTDPPVKIADDDVVDLTEFLTRSMSTTGIGTDEDFVFLHDLRFLWPNPSRVQLSALIKFVGANKKRMDVHLKAIAIILTNNIVRRLINFFLSMFSPAQPVKIMADIDEGFAFLREHCPPPAASADLGDGDGAAAPASASAPAPASSSSASMSASLGLGPVGSAPASALK